LDGSKESSDSSTVSEFVPYTRSTRSPYYHTAAGPAMLQEQSVNLMASSFINGMLHHLPSSQNPRAAVRLLYDMDASNLTTTLHGYTMSSRTDGGLRIAMRHSDPEYEEKKLPSILPAIIIECKRPGMIQDEGFPLVLRAQILGEAIGTIQARYKELGWGMAERTTERIRTVFVFTFVGYFLRLHKFRFGIRYLQQLQSVYQPGGSVQLLDNTDISYCYSQQFNLTKRIERIESARHMIPMLLEAETLSAEIVNRWKEKYPLQQSRHSLRSPRS
jgi:hypothetical protein